MTLIKGDPPLQHNNGLKYSGEIKRDHWQHIRKLAAPFLRRRNEGQTLLDSNIWTSTKQRRNRLLAAVELVYEAVVFIDTEGTILYVNPSWERITGYSRAEAIGQNLHFRKSYKDSEAFYKELWTTITNGDVWHGRLTNMKKDDMLYEEVATIYPFQNASGNIVGYIVIMRDISKEIELEERLRQPHKMEAIGRLAGGIAHDFNNILTVISGNTQLALLTLEEENPLYERLQIIQRSTKHAEELTNKLLAFGRKQIVNLRVLNLNDVISSLMPILQRLISEDIELVVQLGTKLSPVRIDPGQIEQILVNLVINACEAMPEGGTLIIETANADLDESYTQEHYYVKPGQYVMMAISDNGHGMSEEIQSQIFEPFFTSKERGTGLGLSTVYGIVKQNEGSIEVESEEDVGTTVWLYLPIVDAPAEIYTPEDEITDLPRGSETILLAEDSDEIRLIVTENLENLGYTLYDFPSAEDAMKFYEQFEGTFDLLLTDVVMTGKSGFALANQLELLQPSISILFMSGHVSDTIVRYGGLKEGMDLLHKPFTPAGLATKVREVLDR